MTFRPIAKTIIETGSILLCTSIFIGCAGEGSQQTLRHSWAPLQLDDGWAIASATDVALDPCLLDSMTAAIRRNEEYVNVHAVLIVKDGRLAYEQYFDGEDVRLRGDARERVSLSFRADMRHDSRSVAKSVTSALVGIALGEGAISSLDTPLFDFFPEHASLASRAKRQITLRHALTMSAGLDWNETDVPYPDPQNHETQMGESEDPAAFVLGRSLAAEPGSTWNYNGGLPTLLGMVVSRVTGQSFGAYARERLFDPLGITDVEWSGPRAWSEIPELQWEDAEFSSRGLAPFGSLWIRPRDLAKFGTLYLNDGRWQERQILPRGWVEESTQRLFTLRTAESDEYGEFGYGYFWWYNLFRTSEGNVVVHTAVGNGEQRIYVVPSLDMVVVHHAGRYDEDGEWMSERLLLNYIVPAARQVVPADTRSCGTQ